MKKDLKKQRRVSWEVPENRSRRPSGKNLIYCQAARRTKLQFLTHRKAEKYIEWNSKEIRRISGKAPVRAYWCNSCMCYHVTSHPIRPINPTIKSVRRFVELAKTSVNPEMAKEYLQLAYQELVSAPDGSEWIQAEASKVLEVLTEIDRREFDLRVKEAEYLLRIQDWSGSEIAISWLEKHPVNPGKIEKLRAKLLSSIKLPK